MKDFLSQGTYLEEDYPYISGDTEAPGDSCRSSEFTAVETADVAVTGVRFATNDDQKS